MVATTGASQQMASAAIRETAAGAAQVRIASPAGVAQMARRAQDKQAPVPAAQSSAATNACLEGPGAVRRTSTTVLPARRARQMGSATTGGGKGVVRTTKTRAEAAACLLGSGAARPIIAPRSSTAGVERSNVQRACR